MARNLMRDVLFGVCVGDALGVPVEFLSRDEIRDKSVENMIGYGTYNQPAGTWSDDSSLTFCLAESLKDGYNLKDIGEKFIKWYDEAYWTPYDEMFDIGEATSRAIRKLKKGVEPQLAGGCEEFDNGNGSLMRILPLVFYVKDLNVNERINVIREVSSITHGHIRSIIACCFYIDYAINIIDGLFKEEAYFKTIDFVKNYFSKEDELRYFSRLLDDIRKLKIDEISSTGYVIDSIESAFWCLLNFDRYEDIVVNAVKLGDDTDTTAAIAGGLAGLIYGYDSIPKRWIDKIARKNDIEKLSEG